MIELNLRLLSNSKKLAFLQTECLEDVYIFIFNLCKWTPDKYYLRSNGVDVLNLNDINGQLEIIPRLRGGKGGFGSMLRAIGAQIEKTTNREACRDLSGRRLRDINEEQRLKKWISQQSERERESEERRKRKLEKLSSEPKHEFKDETYYLERSEMTEKLNDAFEQGVQASTSVGKRKMDVKKKPIKKKKKLLVDFDEFSSSDDAEESNGSDSDGKSDHSLENVKNEASSVSNSSHIKETEQKHSTTNVEIKNTVPIVKKCLVSSEDIKSATNE